MDEDQAQVICEELFEYYYPGQRPPDATMAYYVQQIAGGAMTPDDVQQQIRAAIEASLPKASPEPTPPRPAAPATASPTTAHSFAMSLPSVPGAVSPSAQAAPTTPPPPVAAKPAGASPSPSSSTGRRWPKERIIEFVDQLCITYCGGVAKADVVLRTQVINSVVSGAYTLDNAEWAIQTSPEAKRWKSQQHNSQLREYIQELAKRYTPGVPVAKVEEDRLVTEVNKKQTSL
jgi:hypothetical protein